MRSTLFQFFYNGLHLRVSMIRKVIGCLYELKKAIEKQNSFRFFSSSLLIIYEGCVQRQEDFFGLLESEGCGRRHGFEEEESMDDGSHCFEEEEDKDGLDAMMVDDESSLESSNDSTSASASLSWLSSRKMTLEVTKKCKADHGPEVDVRMIDFAHTTYAGYDGEPTVYSGPDTGYLLGLDSLIRLLREVENSSSSVETK